MPAKAINHVKISIIIPPRIEVIQEDNSVQVNSNIEVTKTCTLKDGKKICIIEPK